MTLNLLDANTRNRSEVISSVRKRIRCNQIRGIFRVKHWTKIPHLNKNTRLVLLDQISKMLRSKEKNITYLMALIKLSANSLKNASSYFLKSTQRVSKSQIWLTCLSVFMIMNWHSKQNLTKNKISLTISSSQMAGIPIQINKNI